MRTIAKYASFFTIVLIFNFSSPSVILGKNKSKTNYSPTPADLISEVNILRASNGLKPYVIDQRLMNIAQAHSDYQASIGTVTHYGADGSRPFQRALEAGYPVAGDLSQGGFFSENIASGINFSVSAVVISWQSDAPHLNTMLSTTGQDIGAGVTIVDETIFYTIDVGLSSDSPYSPPSGSIQDSPSLNQINRGQKITNTPQPDGSIIHVVELGETLWVISWAYGIPVDEIIRLNNLQNDFIFVGDHLLIQEGTAANPIPPTSTVTPTSTIIAPTTPSSTINPTLSDPIKTSELEGNKNNYLGAILSAIVFIGVVIFAIIRTNITKNINK